MNHPHSIREEHLIKEHCGFSGIMGYVTFHRKTRRGLSTDFLSHEKEPLSCFSQVKETAKCHKKDPHKNALHWQRELKVFLNLWRWMKIYDVMYVCMYLPFFKICCLVLCFFYLFIYLLRMFFEKVGTSATLLLLLLNMSVLVSFLSIKISFPERT